MRLAKTKRRWATLLAIALLLLASATLPSAAPAVAQSGGGYDLSWHTVDGGGGSFSSGGSYRLGGTIGQPDAGVLAGGEFVLVGGFWRGVPGTVWGYQVYLPITMRRFP